MPNLPIRLLSVLATSTALLPSVALSAAPEAVPPAAPWPAPPGPAPAEPTFETEVAAPNGELPAPPAPQFVLVPRDPAATVAPERRDPCEVTEPGRTGFYLRFIEGTGYAKFSGTGPQGSVSASGLGSHSTIAIGGGVARGLAIAGTIQSTMTEATFAGGPFTKATLTTDSGTAVASAKAKLTQAQVGALVDWYPRLQSGFHGGLSAGLGAISLINDADDSKLAGTAVSGSLFLGYDAAISRSWALGLAAVMSGATSASMKDSNGNDSGYKLSAFSIQLGASLLFF
jgi:hypothetical protein